MTQIEYINKSARALLNKYSDGVPYVDTVWIGDDKLELNKPLKGMGRHENSAKTYNCFSNEFILDKGLRVNTKGRLEKTVLSSPKPIRQNGEILSTISSNGWQTTENNWGHTIVCQGDGGSDNPPLKYYIICCHKCQEKLFL